MHGSIEYYDIFTSQSRIATLAKILDNREEAISQDSHGHLTNVGVL